MAVIILLGAARKVNVQDSSSKTLKHLCHSKSSFIPSGKQKAEVEVLNDRQKPVLRD